MWMQKQILVRVRFFTRMQKCFGCVWEHFKMTFTRMQKTANVKTLYGDVRAFLWVLNSALGIDVRESYANVTRMREHFVSLRQRCVLENILCECKKSLCAGKRIGFFHHSLAAQSIRTYGKSVFLFFTPEPGMNQEFLCWRTLSYMNISCIVGVGPLYWPYNLKKTCMITHTHTHLGAPVIGFLKLQVFASFAAQVHPLPFQPLKRRLPQKIRRVHLGHEGYVLPCSRKMSQIEIKHHYSRSRHHWNRWPLTFGCRGTLGPLHNETGSFRHLSLLPWHLIWRRGSEKWRESEISQSESFKLTGRTDRLEGRHVPIRYTT